MIPMYKVIQSYWHDVFYIARRLTRVNVTRHHNGMECKSTFVSSYSFSHSPDPHVIIIMPAGSWVVICDRKKEPWNRPTG